MAAVRTGHSVDEVAKLTRRVGPIQIDVIEPGNDTGTLGATQSMPAPTPRVSRSRRAWLSLAGVAVLAGVTTWGITHLRRDVPVQTLLIPSGWSEPLFNGRSLRNWNVRSGTWVLADDEDGAKVLAGANGAIARRLLRSDEQPPRPLSHFELSLAVRLHQATAIELHFGISQAAGENAPRSAIRLEGQAAWLARRSADRSPSRPATPSVSLPTTSADQPRIVRLRRDATHWIASVDNQRVGAIPLASLPELAEIRLSVDGGPAWFSDIEVEELVPPIAQSPSH